MECLAPTINVEKYGEMIGSLANKMISVPQSGLIKKSGAPQECTFFLFGCGGDLFQMNPRG